MRELLYPTILALTFLAPIMAQRVPGPSETEAVHQQIQANQHAIEQAIRTHDFSALQVLWSPQMVVNSPDNTILTRDKVIAAMQRGGLNYSALKGTVESFTVFGDVAVEMGHEDFVMAVGPAAGKALQRRFTDVWQRSGDRWVQVARQATILDVDAASVYGAASASSQPLPHQD